LESPEAWCGTVVMGSVFVMALPESHALIGQIDHATSGICGHSGSRRC
jgi:hypothetical protein